MKHSWMILGAALALLTLTSGCVLFVAGAAASVGAGTYAYVNGEVKETEAASLDHTWNAAQAALQDIKCSEITQAKDAVQGELTARDANGKKVAIHLKRVTDNSTEVSIRVGTLGDESQGRLVLYKIKSHR